MTEGNESRRDFVKRATYVTPAVLTLAAAPEFAKAGSVKVIDIGKDRNPGLGKDPDLGKALGRDGGPRRSGGHGHAGSADNGRSARKHQSTDGGGQRAAAPSSRVKDVAPSTAASACGSADGRMGGVDCANPK